MQTNQPSTPPSAPVTAPVEIYLGKNGETFGPYTIEQFEAIQASAEYATYSYIWDGRDPGADWQPIKRAPSAPPRRGPSAPPPSDAALAQTPAAQTPAAAEQVAEVIPITRARGKAAPVLKGYDVPWIEAVCHDTRHVISGRLTQVTDTGCELVCPATAGAQSFGSQSHVVINLLDAKSGQAMNVAARLSGVTRREGKWSLKVLWDGCPELIVAGLEQLDKAA